MRQFTVVCDDGRAERIEALAVKYDLTEREVVEQLVSVGLEELD